MPEGDTLFRTASVLRRALVGHEVTAARARAGGARLDLIVDSHIEEVRSQGKHLLIGFDVGLTLHTHLGMHGSWHRYAASERWRRPADAAVAVLETAGSVAVCFDAPVVELIETRALALHPGLARLGPDLLAPEPDIASATARLRAPERAHLTVAEALLDQSAVAGIGNVYRSEVLAIRSMHPFLPVGEISEAVLIDLLREASRLLRANVGGGERATVPGARPGTRWVYGRAGRPCRRCGAIIRSAPFGSPPRRLFWCPRCQA
jgi:endonuclease-8